jgi:hypothetical protein
MYAVIKNLDNGHEAITGNYRTLTALTQNAVLFYWNKNGKCNMLVKYYSSFDVPIEFRIEYFDANGLRRES